MGVVVVVVSFSVIDLFCLFLGVWPVCGVGKRNAKKQQNKLGKNPRDSRGYQKTFRPKENLFDKRDIRQQAETYKEKDN